MARALEVSKTLRKLWSIEWLTKQRIKGSDVYPPGAFVLINRTDFRESSLKLVDLRYFLIR